MVAVGIDDLNLYASSLSVDAADIALARGRSEREVRKMELICRSLPPNYEDPISLAVNAANPIVSSMDKQEIELLIVATESGVDYGKPLSSYVHKYLGLNARCRNIEFKHACYAGTAAVQLATSWVKENGGKAKALVVMADMARKIFDDPAEPAEGAGAVAVLVAAEPRVLALEPVNAYVSREVYDVTRPTPTLERANASLSLGAYLDLFEMALADYRRHVGNVSLDEYFQYIIYHTPLVPLVREAHHLFVEANCEDATAQEVEESFMRKVRPSFVYCQQIGNIYGGSLYAALAGLVDTASPLEPGSRIGLYSYGSGSCAELFSGVIAEHARITVGKRAIAQALAGRRKVGIGDYERLAIEHERGLTQPEFVPDRSIIPEHYDQAYRGKGLLVLDRVTDYYRTYSWS